MLLYFHANAEDVILANELLENIKNFLKIHVIAVEYPGYGLFQKQWQRRHSDMPIINQNLSKQEKA